MPQVAARCTSVRYSCTSSRTGRSSGNLSLPGGRSCSRRPAQYVSLSSPRILSSEGCARGKHTAMAAVSADGKLWPIFLPVRIVSARLRTSQKQKSHDTRCSKPIDTFRRQRSVERKLRLRMRGSEFRSLWVNPKPRMFLNGLLCHFEPCAENEVEVPSGKRISRKRGYGKIREGNGACCSADTA